MLKGSKLVYSVGGTEVDTVSCATTTTPDVEFIKYFGLNQFVGFSSHHIILEMISW